MCLCIIFKIIIELIYQIVFHEKKKKKKREEKKLTSCLQRILMLPLTIFSPERGGEILCL